MSDIFVQAVIRQEVAVVSVITNERLELTHLQLSDGTTKLSLEFIQQFAKLLNVPIKQALHILMSEAHRLETYEKNCMSIHYLDILSNAGRAARYDVDVYVNDKLSKSLVGEVETTIRQRYDSLVVELNKC